jgi:SAM-dependent methyltransferase
MAEQESAPGRERAVAGMRRSWERFAREDPLWAIETSRRRWEESEFAAHGEAAVHDALERLGPATARKRLLEIGCGAGRTLFAFAAHFDAVVGVDISPEMLELARRRGPPANAELRVTSGADLRPLEDGVFDVVFSQHVLQHVPDEAVVAGYLSEVARVLAPGGRALLQVDTRPQGTMVRALRALPDPLRRRERRRHLRRYPRDAAVIRTLVARSGLAVEWESGAGTAAHWLRLAPAASASTA